LGRRIYIAAMKLLLLVVFFAISVTLTRAQSIAPPQSGQPVMTTAFSDSLKHEVLKLIHRDYGVKFLYRSTLSAEGKLGDPKILKEIVLDEENNYSVLALKLRSLIMGMPAWKTADHKASPAADVTFYIIIEGGKVDIGTDSAGKFDRQ